MEPGSRNSSTSLPKFSHLSLSKALRAGACAHMGESALLVTVFEDVHLCERDATPETQTGKAVRKDQVYFEQILRVQLEETVKVNAFQKSSD